MAAIFLVLAVVDAALLANVALTNTSASSLSVFDQSMTRFTQGELLLVAAGLGLLLALFLRIAWSSSSARRAKRRQLRVATGGGGQGRGVGARERPPAQGAGGHAAPRRAGGAAWGVQRGLVANRGRPAIPRSTRHADGAARPRPDFRAGRGRGRVGRFAFGSLAASRRCPAGPPVGEYGGRVSCGSGLAVPACVVGWSEP